jgi:cystathionine beta-lyase/cystathionine gamma-synthase
MPDLNPKTKRKLTVEGSKLGHGQRVGKRSGATRPLTPNERISQLEGRVGELETALRALLGSTGMSAHKAQRYAPVRIQGDPLSSTILRDRGTY